jgi:hypothetical protein
MGDVVGEPGRAELGLAVDGLAAEGVDALREQLLELLEGEDVEGWLTALGEQLGQAIVLEGPLAVISTSLCPLGL